MRLSRRKIKLSSQGETDTLRNLVARSLGTSKPGLDEVLNGRRIAMVSDAILPFNMGGKERALHEIAKRLVANGHQVDIYTMHWWDGSSTMCSDGITFHAISKLLPLYNSAGRRSLKQAIFFALALTKMVARPFDYLYFDSIPFFPLLTGRLLAWIRRKQLITTWHEYWGPSYWKSYLPGPTGLIGAGLERLASWCPNTVISVSPHTTSRLEEGSAARHVVTVPLGADLRAIDNAEPACGRIDVLFAGRLLTNKNVDLLVEAIALLRPEWPHIQCVIVGDGPEREHIENLIDRLNLQMHVVLRPFLPSSTDLYGLMKSAGVFVLPSVREGFGLVVIEAQRCGTPVITVDHPENAARHLVEAGLNGCLCAPDISEIAETVRQVLGGTISLPDRATIRQSVDGCDWDNVATAFERVLFRQTARKLTSSGSESQDQEERAS
jgi:glycosyltransferase involved in cell wall biosynthesis